MMQEPLPKLHTRAGAMGEDFDATLCGEPGFRIGIGHISGTVVTLQGYESCVACAAIARWLAQHPEVVAYIKQFKGRPGPRDYAMDPRD